MFSHRAGVKKELGAPIVHGDELDTYYDVNIGREISSKSERDRCYAQMGLQIRSASELHREHGKIGMTHSERMALREQTRKGETW